MDDRIEGLDAGADDYLTKPFNMGELLARVRAMTRRKAVFIADVITFGDISLDKQLRQLSTQDSDVKLANKEFQILEILMETPQMIFSAEQLLEKIWGLDSDVETNSIWVHISNLLKKLQGLHSNVKIIATRGAGYSLEELHD